MRETRPSGSEGGGTQPNESSLPLFLVVISLSIRIPLSAAPPRSPKAATAATLRRLMGNPSACRSLSGPLLAG
jgi:hypothetical protein